MPLYYLLLFSRQWEEITHHPSILQFVKGTKIEFKPGVTHFQTCVQPSTFNQSRSDIAALEIDKLLSKVVLHVSLEEEREFISPVFVRSKPDRTFHVILSLQCFNEFVQGYHFKLDTLESVIRLMKPKCFTASIDLNYSVSVAKEHQKYLKFIFNGTLSKYKCLPNGLSSAPRVFTKLLKPAHAWLRTQGHFNLGYIDDSYLQGDTYVKCNNNVKATAFLFKRLGFNLHLTKSVIIPTQNLLFLGASG